MSSPFPMSNTLGSLRLGSKSTLAVPSRTHRACPVVSQKGISIVRRFGAKVCAVTKKQRRDEEFWLSREISQSDIAKQHSILLEDNYNKLKEMYDVQLEVNRQTKIELLRARRYNIAMMIISIIAMLAAIAGPVVTMVFGE